MQRERERERRRVGRIRQTESINGLISLGNKRSQILSMSTKMSLKGENKLTISVQTFKTASKQPESFHTQVGVTVINVKEVTIFFFFLHFFLPGSQAGCWSLSELHSGQGRGTRLVERWCITAKRTSFIQHHRGF